MPTKAYMDRIFYRITLYDQMVSVNDCRLSWMPASVFTGNFKMTDGFIVIGFETVMMITQFLKMNCEAILTLSVRCFLKNRT